MKQINKLKFSFSLFSFMSIIATYAQLPIQDSIVRIDGVPNYFWNEMIIKFNPKLVDSSVINDRNIQTGIVSDFLNKHALSLIIENNYFDSLFANLKIKKIHHNLTIYDDSSTTRLGNKIPIPAYWSTFLLTWNNNVGLPYEIALDSLKKLWPIVEYAHPNYVISVNASANDPQYFGGNQAGLKWTPTYNNHNINIETAWDYTTGKDNCRVGVFDSGINWYHDDFSENGTNLKSASRVKGGFNYIQSRRFQDDNSNLSIDIYGHGTPIAGIIGAIRNNELGVAGIAGGDYNQSQLGVRLYDFKILNNSGTLSRVSDAIDAITEGATSENNSYGYTLDVMNHSWGVTIGQLAQDAEALKESIRYANKNNVAIVVASGNTGNTNVHYPATFNDGWVMKTGGSQHDNGGWWSIGTYGNNIDFIAPATKQLYASLDHNNNTTYNYNIDGTSFSAPHVAGVAALMSSYISNHSEKPNNLAPEDIEELLEKYATDVETLLYDDYTGYGRINAGLTLQKIALPNYEVKHYSIEFENSSALLYQSNVSVFLAEDRDGLPSGYYNCDVYKITKEIDVSQPIGRNILDVWVRNSSSTMFGPDLSIPEVNIKIVSWNQNKVVIEGYIYQIKDNGIFSYLNKWFPENGLNDNGKFAITVYSHNLWNNNINSNILKNEILYSSNPSDNGIFKIQTEKNLENSIVNIKDMTGKLIKTLVVTNNIIDLNDLSNWIYICELENSGAFYINKLIISR